MSDDLSIVKATHIKACLAANDLRGLRNACKTGLGLVSTKLRKEVWPVLMGVTPDLYPDWRNFRSNGLVATKQTEVIDQDVEMEFEYLDIVADESTFAKAVKREQLKHILGAVTGLDPSLNYYQGFSGVASVFFLVGGEDFGFKLSMKAAQHYLKDCMRSTFEEGFLGAMKAIYTLIYNTAPELHQVLTTMMPEVNNSQLPIPCIGWVLGWFTQEISSFAALCRIFDFLIASHSLAPVYLAATVKTTQILLELKVSIMALKDDKATLQDLLYRVLLYLNWESTIEACAQLLEAYPPEKLIGETSFAFFPE